MHAESQSGFSELPPGGRGREVGPVQILAYSLTRFGHTYSEEQGVRLFRLILGGIKFNNIFSGRQYKSSLRGMKAKEQQKTGNIQRTDVSKNGAVCYAG